MRKVFALSAALLLAVSQQAAAVIVTQWNFNSGSDANSATGTTIPSIGSGIASLVGGVTSPSFNSGVGSSDTEPTDNSGWQTTTYPATGANKSAGVQFAVSTVGYDNIMVSWDQRHSNTSANTTRLQYTLDLSAGSPVWVDDAQFTFTPAASGTGDTWYNSRSSNLSAITGVNNNPNFAFRVVSEFSPVTGGYLASRSTSTYSGGGTWRFDMATVSGTVAIPEPSAYLFGAVATLMAGAGVYRRRFLA